MTDTVKLGLVVALLLVAAVLCFRFFRQDSGVSEKAFFYDLSERKLFTGPRTKVPPTKGLHGPEEDAVRAVVVSTNGKATDRRSWKIAYLEKYSDEAKRQMEQAQAGGASPTLNRTEMLAHRFVKRVSDSQWYPMYTPEAERIVSDWAVPGADGTTPVVCAP
jgi:hypothetical protein